MIENDNDFGLFNLICDSCGDDCEEFFDTFQEVVEFKREKENGWRSVKDKDGYWQDICPACSTHEIDR
jgi:hypothetical protein